MEFIKKVDENDIEELRKCIDKNIRLATIMRKEVEKHHTSETNLDLLEEQCQENSFENEEIFEGNDDFEDEILYYLSEIVSLPSDISKESLISLLPEISDYNYEKILLRIMAELSKETNEAYKLLKEEMLSTEEFDLLQEEIISNRRKISLLKELILEEEQEEINHKKVENKLVFMPTQSGNPCVISELKHIDSEYYPSFSNLFESIITGKFKNLKKFSQNSVPSGLYEVKDFGIRIIISRLGPREYCVISAFTKKTDNNKDYQAQINLRALNFKQLESSLKEKISNEEFMNLQSNYQEELFNMLGKDNRKGQVKEKKDDLK